VTFVKDPSKIGGHLKDVHVERAVKDAAAPTASGLAGVVHRLAYNTAHYTSVLAGGRDPNPRHAIPGMPALPLLVGAAALLGAALAAREAGLAGQVLLVFAVGALLAGILADPSGVPNTFRICAFLVPAFVWAALALERAAARLGRLAGASAAALLILAAAAVLSLDGTRFLSRWPFERVVEARFAEGETEAGRLLFRLTGEARVDAAATTSPWAVALFARGGAGKEPLAALATGPGGEEAYWYLTDASRARALCAARACGRAVPTSLAQPGLVLVRVGRAVR